MRLKRASDRLARAGRREEYVRVEGDLGLYGLAALLPQDGSQPRSGHRVRSEYRSMRSNADHGKWQGPSLVHLKPLSLEI